MSPLQSIAHYRILSKLGEGGMGTVYRATDTKLNRDVAIKILPDAFAQDPDRLARFTREAQLLASLNHPNIAAIYGVEERALILELVEGPTLDERIAAGPLPVDEALSIAGQIAAALEYAHEKAIIHRDLKPANIKVTADGRVKVLDFGLAKAMASESSVAQVADSPTLTMRATVAGVIMGTAAYMAPEQAKGKPVDRRADIWAFGVLLVEMLNGRPLYNGETVSEILAAVIKDQPDLTGLPPNTPPAVRHLLARCLHKDPLLRLQAIGEARIAIEGAPASAETLPAASDAVPPQKKPVRWMIAAAFLACTAIALALQLWRATQPVSGPFMRFSADLGREVVPDMQSPAAISPDGTRLVYRIRGRGEVPQLAMRLLTEAKVTLLPGTEYAANPFFSPDGKWVGFFADQKMKKVSLQGGTPVTLCEAYNPRGAAWGEDGTIVVSLNYQGLYRVPSTGGKPELLRARSEGSIDRWPQFLPGGQNVLYTASLPESGGYENAGLAVMNLKSGAATIVQSGGYYGRYLPTGHLVYVHEDALMAVPFDADRLAVRGSPVPVLDDMGGVSSLGTGKFDFSGNGTFVYRSGSSGAGRDRGFVWMDSTGKQEPILAEPGGSITPRISPDGKRLAVSRQGNLVVLDLQRDTPISLTHGPILSRFPIWMPDGKHIVFARLATQGTDFGIWWVRTDGGGEPEELLSSKAMVTPSSLSPDGRLVVFTKLTPDSGYEIWTMPLDLSDPDHPKPGKPQPFLIEPGSPFGGALSPDGRWMAYTSGQTGPNHIFVRAFPGGAAGERWQISSAPAQYPIWSPSGRDLFFVSQGSRIMVVSYTVKGATFTAEKPRQWSPVAIGQTQGLLPTDVAPDGKRFVIMEPDETTGDTRSTAHVTVLLNFFDELRRRVPSGK